MTEATSTIKATRSARPEAEPDFDPAIANMLRGKPARDAKGRFKKSAPATLPSRPIVPGPADAHPDAYALAVTHGAGARLPPGSHVIVEPVRPTKAGYAVLYRKGTGPQIWDLTQNYVPDVFDVVGDGSGLSSLVEVVAPDSGRIGWLNADGFEKAHRIVGVYMSTEIAVKARQLPPDLPLMPECPEGMGEQFVDDAVLYPLVRPRETVIYDPAKRDLVSGAICVLEWSNGSRAALQINKRTVGNMKDKWWVDPVHRPDVNRLIEITPADKVPVMYASDGPYSAELLQSKIVGRVVGILQVRGGDHEVRRGYRHPAPKGARNNAQAAEA